MRLWTFPLLLAPLCACSPRQLAFPPVIGAEAVAPFGPVAMRIHPLTHIDAAARNKDGSVPDSSRIVLHLELRDRSGDSVKAIGNLMVELLKPGTGVLPGMDTHELTWDVPELMDVDENIRRFDPPTRTYRIVLNGPRWIGEWAAAGRTKDSAPWLKLRAVYTLSGENGSVLSDEYAIQN